ncbi:MAG: hypothetical protein ACOYJV_11135 [Aminivibrio sp.]|jgi:hypothetical protein
MKISSEEYKVLFPGREKTEALKPLDEKEKTLTRPEEDEAALEALETRTRELADLGLGLRFSAEG